MNTRTAMEQIKCPSLRLTRDNPLYKVRVKQNKNKERRCYILWFNFIEVNDTDLQFYEQKSKFSH